MKGGPQYEREWSQTNHRRVGLPPAFSIVVVYRALIYRLTWWSPPPPPGYFLVFLLFQMFLMSLFVPLTFSVYAPAVATDLSILGVRLVILTVLLVHLTGCIPTRLVNCFAAPTYRVWRGSARVRTPAVLLVSHDLCPSSDCTARAIWSLVSSAGWLTCGSARLWPACGSLGCGRFLDEEMEILQ
jgi:hypothetical protein